MRAHDKVTLECNEVRKQAIRNLSSKPAFYTLDLTSKGHCRPYATIFLKDDMEFISFEGEEPDITKTFRIEIPAGGYVDIGSSWKQEPARGCTYQLFEDEEKK